MEGALYSFLFGDKPPENDLGLLDFVFIDRMR
jgi:hypothetical protein